MEKEETLEREEKSDNKKKYFLSTRTRYVGASKGLFQQQAIKLASVQNDISILMQRSFFFFCARGERLVKM
jgi:hypothetical protein